MAGSRLEDQDLDAEAEEALEAARAMPRGPEKVAALKKAGLLRMAADARKIAHREAPQTSQNLTGNRQQRL
jgi:hypothetical protein